MTAQLDVLQTYSKADGWIVVVSLMQCVVIPTGFMTLSMPANDTTCKGIRWSLSSCDSDKCRVGNQLKELLPAFPEVRQANTGYQQLHDFLTS